MDLTHFPVRLEENIGMVQKMVAYMKVNYSFPMVTTYHLLSVEIKM